MIKYGHELEFISRIRLDGSGTDPVANDDVVKMQKNEFEIFCLSIIQNTYIACGFNSFVVKLKEPFHPQLNHKK